MGFFIGGGAGNNGHIHALGAFDFVQFNFRENRLVGNAESIIAATVEFARGQSAEVANAREGSGDEAVKKLVHGVFAQSDAAADGLVFAQLEIGDALA